MDLAERHGSSRRHPWEVVRGAFFLRLLADHADPSTASVLDVGAGDSWFGTQLATAAPERTRPIVCWDVAYTDDDLAESPPGVVRTRHTPDDRFEIVLLMDVLEHIADPMTFLVDEVQPRLAPGATVLASVPAHPRLFGAHDVALGHHRRYRPREFLDEVATLAPIIADGPLFVSLTPPRALQVTLERVREPGPQEGIGGWRRGTSITTAVTAALRGDAAACRWLSRHSVPIRGLSHWAVARVAS